MLSSCSKFIFSMESPDWNNDDDNRAWGGSTPGFYCSLVYFTSQSFVLKGNFVCFYF